MRLAERTRVRRRVAAWLSASLVGVLTASGCSAGKAPTPPSEGAQAPGGKEAAATEPSQREREENSLRGEHAELFELVREQGQLRLIVGLDPAPERGELTEEAIAALVDAWLESVPSEHVTPGRRFRTIPHLVVTVDESGLQAVTSSERVVSIEIDGLAAPPDATAR